MMLVIVVEFKIINLDALGAHILVSSAGKERILCLRRRVGVLCVRDESLNLCDSLPCFLSFSIFKQAICLQFQFLPCISYVKTVVFFKKKTNIEEKGFWSSGIPV